MGWLLPAYLAASHAIPVAAPLILRRRLARGKEDPARLTERLGLPTAPRPPGRLVWLHAVGLGEVLSLRGLIAALSQQDGSQRDGGLSFLVTSGTRASAQVLAANLPPRTVHQFLPMDAPRYLSRFLAHWRPDLSVWAEQDVWPGAVAATHRAGIPLALVNARMNDAAFARRARARSLYADILSRFALVAAQDEATARNLAALGARAPRVTGALKAAAPPLAADPDALAALRAALRDRSAWLLASSHPEDEEPALAARAAQPAGALLVIVPRDPARGAAIAARAAALGLAATQASQGPPRADAAVHVVDAFGTLGLWYRLCPVSLIGGTFGPTEGHNPWEAAALGSAILHGPRTANFADDFARLDGAGAALAVLPGTPSQTPAQTLTQALAADHAAMAARALALSQAARDSLAPLAAALLGLMA